MTGGSRELGFAARLILGLGLLAAGAAGAQGLPDEEPAAELKPLQVHSIAVGSLSGIVYFAREADGYRVVATLADAEHWPLRFVATLRPGQWATLSTPGAVGMPPAEMRLEREGDRLILGDGRHRID
jgi:hypothetical protein